MASAGRTGEADSAFLLQMPWYKCFTGARDFSAPVLRRVLSKRKPPMVLASDRVSVSPEQMFPMAQRWLQFIGQLATLPTLQRLAIEDTGRETLLWVVLKEDPDMAVSEQIWGWEQTLRAGPDAGIDVRLVSLDRTKDLSPAEARTIIQR
jgi:hypothetical protein